MALSPWPTSDNADDLAAAISLLKDAIAPGAANDTIARLGAVGAALVEQRAPGAPDPIRDEAVIRLAGYLHDAGSGAIRAESVEGVSIDHVTNHAAAWRNCGAAALLSPWKVRRAAGVVKE